MKIYELTPTNTMSALSFASASPDSKSFFSSKVLPALKPALNIAAVVYPPLQPVAQIANILIRK